ncbi:MAG: hypothetical protein HY370_01485 [Proteobacteria bacterium]|nr:hypothetical protein [Pseudomonadota bacterium]
MPDEDTGVRTRLDIKKSLLRRAIKGESQYSAREMILLIQWIRSRARHIPESHENELDLIREIEQEQEEVRSLLVEMGMTEDDLPSESRALLRLNLEERRRGRNGNWNNLAQTWQLLNRQPPTNSIN